MARVLLRGRQDIVGALRPTFPQFLSNQLAGREADFPLRMGARETEALISDAATGGGRRNAPLLKRILTENGALHLTGCSAVDTPERFQALLTRLGLTTVEYRGGLGHRAGGTKAESKWVYAASDEPAEFTIEMHNEKADTPDLPDVISFWCEIPAEAGQGGETVLLHSDSVLANLDPGVLSRLEEKGICYWRRLKHKRDANYLSWQAVFHTEDKGLVEAYLKQRNFSFDWCAKTDSLTYWNVLPPTKLHPVSGRKVWCNSIQSHHSTYYSVHPKFRSASEQIFTTFYGDQSPIEESVLQHIREVSWSGAIGFQLRRHEVVIADNRQVQHGRMSFRGPRTLKVAISSPWSA